MEELTTNTRAARTPRSAAPPANKHKGKKTEPRRAEPKKGHKAKTIKAAHINPPRPTGASPATPESNPSASATKTPSKPASAEQAPKRPPAVSTASPETARDQVVRPIESARVEPDRAERVPAEVPREVPLWARIVADPGFIPEHVARVAVRDLGPEVRDWVGRARLRYPGADPDAIARLATRHFTRSAQLLGTLAAASRPVGPVAASVVLARTRARLVLAIAAAYGFDPTSQRRVRELLTLLRVPRFTEPVPAALSNLARGAAAIVMRRLGDRVLPFGGAIVTAVQGGVGSADLAARAARHYRRGCATPHRPAD